MIRRFNYTGRRKIPRSRVRIRIAESNDRRWFDAELTLDGLRLPRDAALFVEAYYRAAYRRFAFGTVGDPHAPSERFLDGIGSRKPLFRVKVVRSENGIARILAAADRVVPEDSDHDEDTRLSLLPVEYVDLGDRVWALDLNPDDWPRLLLNKRFEDIREVARSGREFLTLVYPEIFRAVLTRALDEGRFDPNSDDEDWGTLWLRFACVELGRPLPPDTENYESTAWIDDAVNAFCMRVQTVSQFEQLMRERAD